MDSMRIIFVILLCLLLSPSLGATEQIFAVSCNNIQFLHIESNSKDWSVVVKLTPEGTQKFYNVTAENLGDFISINFKGETLLRTRVYEPIESGYIGLRASTKEEALLLAEKICSSKLENETTSSFEKLLPSSGVAEYPKGVSIPAFPVSCENVTHIRILRIKDFIWHDTGDGYMYLVQVVLSPKSSEELLRTLESSPPTVFTLNGSTLSKKYIQLSVQGRTILSDAPTRDGFSDQGILLTKRTKQAAMDCALAICPEKISF